VFGTNRGGAKRRTWERAFLKVGEGDVVFSPRIEEKSMYRVGQKSLYREKIKYLDYDSSKGTDFLNQ